MKNKLLLTLICFAVPLSSLTFAAPPKWRLYCEIAGDEDATGQVDEGEAIGGFTHGYDGDLNLLAVGFVPGDKAYTVCAFELASWDPLVEPDGEWAAPYYRWPINWDWVTPDWDLEWDVALSVDEFNNPTLAYEPSRATGKIAINHPHYGANTVWMYVRYVAVGSTDANGRDVVTLYMDGLAMDNPAKLGQNGLPDFWIEISYKWKFRIVDENANS